MPLDVEAVDDPADPRLADFRDLRDPALRRDRGLFVAEGALVVRRLLAAGRYAVRAALCSPGALRGLAAARGNGDPDLRVYVAPEPLLARVAGYPFHRGCLAVAERGADADTAALTAPPGPRLLVALDDVADPDNVGAVFRNAAAFGADALLLSLGCGDPLYRKAIRTSAGATLALPFARAVDWPTALDALRLARYRVIALTPGAEAEDVDALAAGWPAPNRLALLVGSEGRGLGAESLRAADRRVRIPMAAGVDSLNVATATGIALHALARAGGRVGAEG
jgi:tRNA G18 (ribose-2'-O)-methylase SpoU